MIRAGEFFAAFQGVKTHLAAHPDASEELKSAFSRLLDGFRRSYTPEAFKAALQGDEMVPSDVEDRLTSTLTLLRRELATGVSAGTE